MTDGWYFVSWKLVGLRCRFVVEQRRLECGRTGHVNDGNWEGRNEESGGKIDFRGSALGGT